MYWVDIAIVAIIALSVLTGLLRGFIKEALSLGVWIVAIWLGINYSHTLDPYLQPYIQNQSARTAVAYVIIIVASLLAGAIVSVIISLFLKKSGLGLTDKIIGMGFGFIRGAFIVALIMVIIKMTSLPYQEYTRQSKLYNQFDPIVNWLTLKMDQVLQKVKSVEQSDKAINTIFLP